VPIGWGTTGPLVICSLKSCIAAGFPPPRLRARKAGDIQPCDATRGVTLLQLQKGSTDQRRPVGCGCLACGMKGDIKRSLMPLSRFPVLFLTPARGTRLRLSASSLFLRFALQPSWLIVCFSAPPLTCRCGMCALQALRGADSLSTCGAPVLERRRALEELRRTWATSRSMDKEERRFLSFSSSVLSASRGESSSPFLVVAFSSFSIRVSRLADGLSSRWVARGF
jgi:hypothetical protein